jgi:hypothetical protein
MTVSGSVFSLFFGFLSLRSGFGGTLRTFLFVFGECFVFVLLCSVTLVEGSIFRFLDGLLLLLFMSLLYGVTVGAELLPVTLGGDENENDVVGWMESIPNNE